MKPGPFRSRVNYLQNEIEAPGFYSDKYGISLILYWFPIKAVLDDCFPTIIPNTVINATRQVYCYSSNSIPVKHWINTGSYYTINAFYIYRQRKPIQGTLINVIIKTHGKFLMSRRSPPPITAWRHHT